jgi:hypothetical protein
MGAVGVFLLCADPPSPPSRHPLFSLNTAPARPQVRARRHWAVLLEGALQAVARRHAVAMDLAALMVVKGWRRSGGVAARRAAR